MTLYSIGSLAPIGVSDTPIIVEGGLITDPLMSTVGEEYEGTLTCTISEKGKRKLLWAFGETNNRRKRHGLPMYRKLKR